MLYSWSQTRREWANLEKIQADRDRHHGTGNPTPRWWGAARDCAPQGSKTGRPDRLHCAARELALIHITVAGVVLRIAVGIRGGCTTATIGALADGATGPEQTAHRNSLIAVVGYLN